MNVGVGGWLERMNVDVSVSVSVSVGVGVGGLC